ncbi:MAG: HAMP domain-containing histidine kinase [Proteobacteria bacterium]|nr:HAMP domain-containing histidine kinase [Pseudomonadota bacterium]
MKDDLIEAKELAEHASQAKSEFLSSMSHELHTPLGVILGFAELLQADNLTEDQHDNVSYILSSGHHLLELVDQVLKLSSMEAGSTELLFEPVEVVIILEEVIVLLSPMAHKANIQIHLLSDLTVAVNADYTGLKQIIINLVTNAIKYNHHGGSVSIDWQQTEDNNVKISIIDTGTGIAEANKENVFTAFNRLGKETSNIEGTGIGLIITKNLVK